MNLVRFLWRACREITAPLPAVPAVECCICLDQVPQVLDDSLLSLSERYGGPASPPRSSHGPPSSPTASCHPASPPFSSKAKQRCLSPPPTSPRVLSAELPATFTQLKACHHYFCTVCIRRYVQLKVKSHELERDQLICPQTECRTPLALEDLQKLLQRDGFVKYQQLLQRKRDEQNPNARWCIDKTCGELIVCPTDQIDTFECPKCKLVGCFACGKEAHSKWTKWYVCDQNKLDSSYLHWEKSVGSSHAVRGCPQCQIRIWKNEGCNHMTCSNCRHEFCWVCRSIWSPRHYKCRENSSNSDATGIMPQLANARRRTMLVTRFYPDRLVRHRIKAVLVGVTWLTLLVVVIVVVGLVWSLVYLVMFVLELLSKQKKRLARASRRRPKKTLENAAVEATAESAPTSCSPSSPRAAAVVSTASISHRRRE